MVLDFIFRFAVATALFFVIDIVWLAFISKNLYKKHLGELMKPNVNWVAAILFYLLFMFGLTFFVINPAIVAQSMWLAMFGGALFGLVCYATYDLTNLATLKNWPTLITVVDLAWGTFICFAVSTITYFIFA